jgi:hypothetical protein
MTPRRTRSALFAAALGCAATALTGQAQHPAAAPATPSDTREMQKQIEALQQQVRNLQAGRANDPPYTASDVDAAVGSVVRDADRRSKLLAETGGFYGGFLDDKFQIRSADGNFSLSPSIQFQFRYDTVWNQGVRANGGDNTDSGFEVRRLKLGIDGNAWSRDFYYNFVWATDRKTGNLVNEEAYVTWKFAGEFAVKVGQYKELIYQESSVSSKRLLAVDRTLVDQVFFGGDSYIQGVELDYGTDLLQALVGFSDGYNSVDTNFQDPPVNAFDFGLYARVQYKLFGDWKNYSDMTALGNKKDLLVVGAGGDWSQSGDTDTYRHAIDAQWETGPLALFGAFIGRYADTAAGGSTWDWGGVVQVAYRVNTQWEAFGRYGYFTLDHTDPGAEDQFHEITVGLNYYIRNQKAKITLDAGWLPNGSPSSQDGIGVLANDGRNEFYLRGQFQLLL